MCDGPRGRVDWGLSDCFLRKRLSYSCDTYIFTCVATYNIYLHSVIILLPDLLTNSPRLGIRLCIQRCSCSSPRPAVAKFASDKFQYHIFASVGFPTSFIKSSSMAVKTKAAWYLLILLLDKWLCCCDVNASRVLVSSNTRLCNNNRFITIKITTVVSDLWKCFLTSECFQQFSASPHTIRVPYLLFALLE